MFESVLVPVCWESWLKAPTSMTPAFPPHDSQSGGSTITSSVKVQEIAQPDWLAAGRELSTILSNSSLYLWSNF